MWYEKHNEIDFALPIFAKSKKEENAATYILLLQIGASYKSLGYNWFNIETGTYNSCTFFETPKRAILAYEHNYKIFNGHINIIER